MAHTFPRAVELNIIVERYINWTANTAMESHGKREHPLVSETCFPPCQNRWQLESQVWTVQVDCTLIVALQSAILTSRPRLPPATP
jgi:hypothetical protein